MKKHTDALEAVGKEYLAQIKLLVKELAEFDPAQAENISIPVGAGRGTDLEAVFSFVSELKSCRDRLVNVISEAKLSYGHKITDRIQVLRAGLRHSPIQVTRSKKEDSKATEVKSTDSGS